MEKILIVFFRITVHLTVKEEEKEKNNNFWGDKEKIFAKYVHGKGCKTISKQLDFPVTTVFDIIKRFKDHGTISNVTRTEG